MLTVRHHEALRAHRDRIEAPKKKWDDIDCGAFCFGGMMAVLVLGSIGLMLKSLWTVFFG